MDADDGLASRIDQAIERAASFLLSQQDCDGAWRSEVYSALADGYSLTPTIVTSLMPVAERRADARAAMRRGIAHLTAAADANGVVWQGEGECAYPVYAAAAASWAVVLDDPARRHVQAQRGWLDVVMSHRLGAELGWSGGDLQFGGWGYAIMRPQKPDGDGPYAYEANVSATLFALGALHMAGVERDHAAYRDARVFLQRCQNYPLDVAGGGVAEARFDDGGFFFCPTDAARNKAGDAGVDGSGRLRYRSYGSATADGFRALLLCGLPADDGRVIAARQWLERHFRADSNPGDFAVDREVIRNATYYYYAWSVSHAFKLSGATEIESEHGPALWAVGLAEALLRRQDTGGAWRNRYTDAREDDPLVATPLALAALTICRRSLSDGESGSAIERYRGHLPLPPIGP